METNDVSNHLASDDKTNDDLCEIISSHIKTYAILSDYYFYSNSVIENLRSSLILCRLLSMSLVRPTLL